ncbi:MAG: hypothetical protein ACFE9J_11325 [Candidatus Hermodarchaeota archaeon]
MFQELGKDKNINKKTKRLVLQEEFRPMFIDSVKEILSDIKNYTNTLECKLCHKKIKDTMTPNYFQLRPIGQTQFITFHFLCALKPNVINEFQEKMGSFDYTVHTET